MSLRNSVALALVLSIAGCASTDANEEEADVSSAEAALVACTDTTTGPCEDEAQAPVANPSTLIAWNATTGAITYSVNGVSKTSLVTSNTKVRRAPVARYIPSDPILPIVQRWNNLITSGRTTFGATNPPTDVSNTFSGITGELAVAGAHMRVKLNVNSNVVKALRPVP